MTGAATSPRNHLTIVATPAPIASAKSSGRLCFGRFVLTPAERQLTKNDQPVAIGGRSFDLLLALVEQPGRVIPKRELMERVWPDVVVEDVALRFHMTRLRKILDDGRDDARLIATQVGVGYAFVGIVGRVETASRSGAGGGGLRTELPSRLDRMIGRDHDLSLVAERLAATRLLTIVGAPGVGKTSLAIALARDLEASFTHGACFVDLATVATPDALPRAIADALGAGTGPGDPTSVVLDHLHGRLQLLVLDTCEHLVEGVASLVERIADAAPDVRIVTTSRQALRARNEHVHRLSPHELPGDIATCDKGALAACSAVRLFLHHMATAGGAVGEDAAALRKIAGLCKRLGGAALAIEIAAIRAATHGLDTTLQGEKQSLFWHGRRTAPPRQQTLNAMLDWSYNCLSEDEREVFERLSMLGVNFPLEAAFGAVDDHTLDVGAALDQLVEKSLITPRDGQYHWSETTRLYALPRLEARHQAAAGSGNRTARVASARA
jgi:predicted ATPase/DNA-binding winged helix-turn-helix (wHTH) protein